MGAMCSRTAPHRPPDTGVDGRVGRARRSGGPEHQDVDDDDLHVADRGALDALVRLGGHDPYLSDGVVHLTRPGKTAGSSEASGYIGPGAVKIFTSGWTPLKKDGVYDADQLVAIAQTVESGEADKATYLADASAEDLVSGHAEGPEEPDLHAAKARRLATEICSTPGGS